MSNLSGLARPIKVRSVRNERDSAAIGHAAQLQPDPSARVGGPDGWRGVRLAVGPGLARSGEARARRIFVVRTLLESGLRRP